MKEVYEMFDIDLILEVRERGYIEIDSSYYKDYKNKIREKKINRIL